jgi:hypothetical protein
MSIDPSIREQIVLAAVDALDNDRPDEIPSAVRGRVESPASKALPLLTVYQGTEFVLPMHDEKEGKEGFSNRGDVVRRALALNIDIITTCGPGIEAEAAADPIMTWVTKALAAADRFGGLANEPAEEIGTKFSNESVDVPLCRATMTFRVKYQSRADDPTKLV